MLPTPPRATESALWARLLCFDLDDGAAQLAFSRRLARENGWKPDFARRVVLEYKKFVYLAATCGHPVTPSDEVDQAWHLHLVYTRSYWDELCGQVLGFALHHGPTQGGAAEGHKFQDWYAQTRLAYRAAFGAEPPADVWPDAAVRFGEAPHFRRVNLRRNFLVPRPRWRWPSAVGRRGWLALAGASALVGCTAQLPLNPLNWYGAEFMALFWGLGFTALPLALWLRRRGAGPEDEYLGAPLGTYALARLAGGGQLVADSALAALAHAGHLRFPRAQVVAPRTERPPPAEPYEHHVWSALPAEGTPVASARHSGLNPRSKPLLQLDDELEQAGLLLPPTERRRLNLLPLLAAAALGALGAAKVLVGLTRDRPVGFLLFSLVLLGLATWYGQHHGAWATGRGRRLLREALPLLRQERRAGPLSARVVALTVAFSGMGGLRALGMGAVANHLEAPPSSGGDSGASGCGSSGCGGSGCGGCGGD